MLKSLKMNLIRIEKKRYGGLAIYFRFYFFNDWYYVRNTI